jgi:hypothetical protein
MGHVVYNDNFQLPGGTLVVLPYVRSDGPLIMGFLIGLTSLALLCFIWRKAKETGERGFLCVSR